MTGLPCAPADDMADLVVSLPPEILAMMASFEAASAEEVEPAADPAITAMMIETPVREAFAETRSGEPVITGDRLILAPVLDLTATATLHAALLARRGEPLAIDASGVKRLGGQCLQLLLSAGLTWKADGVPIILAGTSEAFDRDLTLLGIRETELFELEAA